MRYIGRNVSLAFGVVMISGCGHKAPQGQIAATVNGEDVSDAEVRTEIASRPVAIDRKTAIQDIITRKLIVQYGRKTDIDKDPVFLLDQRRVSEDMLASKTLQSIASKVAVPSDGDAEEYLSKHPEVYPNRQDILVDHLEVPEATVVGKDSPQDTRTIDAIAKILTARKVTFNRKQVDVDTLTTNPVTASALNGKAVGAVVTLSMQGMRGYFQILQQRSMPITKAAAMRVAIIRLSSDSSQMALANLERQLRTQADIKLR